MPVSKRAPHLSSNTFDFLRFFAAVLVIFAHSYALSGKLAWPITEEIGNRVTFLAVAIFFMISGYLITQSWVLAPKLKSFLWKRSLRIFPGLAGAAIFTVFVIGLMATELTKAEYLSRLQTWLYIPNAISLFHIQYSLPGVFLQNPYQGLVNGSLWTLPLEFVCYLSVAALGILGILHKKWVILATAMAAAVVSILLSFLPIPVGLMPTLLPLARFSGYFLVGSIFYQLKLKNILQQKFFLLAVVIFSATLATPYYHVLSLLTFPYIVMYLAHYLPRRLNVVRKWGDLSYGMYIYAYPIQQLIVQRSGGRLQPLAVFAISMMLITPLAFTSWHLVEQPALRLKKVYP